MNYELNDPKMSLPNEPPHHPGPTHRDGLEPHSLHPRGRALDSSLEESPDTSSVDSSPLSIICDGWTVFTAGQWFCGGAQFWSGSGWSSSSGFGAFFEGLKQRALEQHWVKIGRVWRILEVSKSAKGAFLETFFIHAANARARIEVAQDMARYLSERT